MQIIPKFSIHGKKGGMEERKMDQESKSTMSPRKRRQKDKVRVSSEKSQDSEEEQKYS